MNGIVSERKSRSETLMDVAWVMAARSTCSRASVGVVIARDGRILSTGYNGAPAGMKHCDHTKPDGYIACAPFVGHKVTLWDNGNVSIDGSIGLYGNVESALEFAAIEPIWEGCKIAIHAEANAISYAARFGVPLENTELYTTFCPCLPCAQLIVAAGITKVYYHQEYRDRSGLALLEDAGFDIITME